MSKTEAEENIESTTGNSGAPWRRDLNLILWVLEETKPRPINAQSCVNF